MIELKVDGMTCGGCVKSVTKAVQREAPNASVDVDLDTGRVRIGADGPADRFARAIEAAGYEVAGS